MLRLRWLLFVNWHHCYSSALRLMQVRGRGLLNAIVIDPQAKVCSAVASAPLPCLASTTTGAVAAAVTAAAAAAGAPDHRPKLPSVAQRCNASMPSAVSTGGSHGHLPEAGAGRPAHQAHPPVRRATAGAERVAAEVVAAVVVCCPMLPPMSTPASSCRGVEMGGSSSIRQGHQWELDNSSCCVVCPCNLTRHCRWAPVLAATSFAWHRRSSSASSSWTRQ